MNTYEFEQLPELPLELFEIAGKLDHAGVAPFLSVISDEIEPPLPPPNQSDIPLGQFYVRQYLSQVLYPKLVCYPQSDLIDRITLDSGVSANNVRGLEPIAKPAMYFKLTSLHGERLKFGYFCTVHYGPWSAEVLEEGPCMAGMPPLWRMSIPAIPDLELAWYGIWDDIPSYPNLTVIKGDLYLHKEATHCCPGYKYCPTTNSCLPEAFNCGDNTPA